MALHWPTFLTRAGSAIVFGAVMLGGLLCNEWIFSALVLLIMLLCLRDFFRLETKLHTQETSKLIPRLVWVFAVLMLLFTVCYCFYPTAYLDQTTYHQSSFVGPVHEAIPIYNLTYNPAIWQSLLFFPVLILLFGFLSKKNLLFHTFYALGGVLYIVLPCLLLLAIYKIDWVWPLAIILMIWCNDTMAYIVGSLIGKTPFSEISPKKTWEGTIGGALLTVIGAAIWAYFSQKRLMIDAIALALCASIAGTAGDLLESRLKRLAGVKDSGNMMPGHGGALDRFDSLIVATPFAFAYLYMSREFFL